MYTIVICKAGSLRGPGKWHLGRCIANGPGMVLDAKAHTGAVLMITLQCRQSGVQANAAARFKASSP
jgi:hypothetical protein